MNIHHQTISALSKEQIQQFITDGFIRLDNAFPRALADEGREILWRETGCDPHDPATWTQPVIRLGGYAQEPFRQAVNMPVLHAAFDQLVGAGRWEPRASLGTFPIRFPHPDDPGDTGWHAEASFAGEDGSWRLNWQSKGRALLMLFLFSDVGEDDAPTRIRVGSHLDVPHLLEPAGEEGLSYLELGQKLDVTANRPVVLATGEVGTVYLCHPFLIHAAQMHHGKNPRFMAQPPLYPAEPVQLHRADSSYSPVEIAIRLGLELSPSGIRDRADPARS
ncbi:MAG: phytanoyl-CoA dioxygenase family protein [Acidobacteria bacterium]|nr:phytanoyl-CoA dioxygenase family protein [Acidobacteriota bacterium]